MTPLIKLVVLAALVLLTSSCAHLNFENTLQPLMGQPIQTAFNVLGYPEAVQRWGSDEVFIWTRSGSGFAVIPQMATTYQSRGSTPFMVNQGMAGPPIYGTVGPQYGYSTTAYNQVVPTQSSFVLKLIADAKTQRIKNYDFAGSLIPARDLMLRARGYYLTVMRQRKAEAASSGATARAPSNVTLPQRN